MSQSLFSLAFGVGTQNRQEAWLEVFYALPLLKPSSEIVAAVAPILGYAAGNQALTFTSQQAYQLADALKGIDAAQSALLAPGGKPEAAGRHPVGGRRRAVLHPGGLPRCTCSPTAWSSRTL